MTRHRIQAVAVTGGIAEGKSTVLTVLSSFGVKVASADEVVKQLWSDQQFQSTVWKQLDLNGNFDKNILRKMLSQFPEIRSTLNAITHPVVMSELACSGADAIEVPLLIEACLQGQFESIWVVTCGPEMQLERLAARLGSLQEAQALIATQLKTKTKIAFADAVVRTNVPLENVKSTVKKTWQGQSP